MLYILRCVPGLLAPFGVLSALLTLLLGVFLAVAAAGAAVVTLCHLLASTLHWADSCLCKCSLRRWGSDDDCLVAGGVAVMGCHGGQRIHNVSTLVATQVAAWYVLSEPVAPAASATRSAAAEVFAPEGDEMAAAAKDEIPRERTTYAQLVEDMIPMAGGRDGPPPALSRHGEFSDWVYTMPTAKYDRNEVGPQSQLLCSQRWDPCPLPCSQFDLSSDLNSQSCAQCSGAAAGPLSKRVSGRE